MKYRQVLCHLVAMVTIVNGLTPNDESGYNTQDVGIDNKEVERIRKFTPRGLRSQLGLARERIGCKYQRRGSVPCNEETRKETLKLVSGNKETCAPTIDRKCNPRGRLLNLMSLIWPKKELNKNMEVETIDAEKNEVKMTNAKKAEVGNFDAGESIIRNVDAENIESIEVENEVEKMNTEKAEVEKIDSGESAIEKMDAEIAVVENEVAEKVEGGRMNAERAELEKMVAEIPVVKMEDTGEAKIENMEAKTSGVQKMNVKNDRVTVADRNITDDNTKNVKQRMEEEEHLTSIDYYISRFKSVAPDLDVENMSPLEIIQLYLEAKMDLLEEESNIDSKLAVYHKMRELKIKGMIEGRLPDKQPFLQIKHDVKDANGVSRIDDNGDPGALSTNQYSDSGKTQSTLRNGASNSASKIDNQGEDTDEEPFTKNDDNPRLKVVDRQHATRMTTKQFEDKYKNLRSTVKGTGVHIADDKYEIVEKANEKRDQEGQLSFVNEANTDVINGQNDQSNTNYIDKQLDNSNEEKGNSTKFRHGLSTLDANNGAFTSNINFVDNNGAISNKTLLGPNLLSEAIKEEEKQGNENNDDLSSSNAKSNAIDVGSDKQEGKNSHKNYFKEMRRLNLLQLKKIKMGKKNPTSPSISTTKSNDKDDDDGDNNHTVPLEKLDETDHNSTETKESRTSKDKIEPQKLSMVQVNVNKETITTTDKVTAVDTKTTQVPKVLEKASNTLMNVDDEKEVNGKTNNDNSLTSSTPQTQNKPSKLINIIKNESPTLSDDKNNENEDREIKSTDNNPMNKNMNNNQAKIDRTVIEEPLTSPQIGREGTILRTRARNSNEIHGNGRRRNMNAMPSRRQRNRENENSALNNGGRIRGEVLNRIRSSNPRNRLRIWNNPFTVNRGRIQEQIRRSQEQRRASSSNAVNETGSNEAAPNYINRPPRGCRYQSARSVPCNPETGLRISQLLSGPSSCPKSRSIPCRESRHGRRRGSRRRNKRQAILPEHPFVDPDMTFHSQFTIPQIAIPDDIPMDSIMSNAQIAETASLLSRYQDDRTRDQMPSGYSLPLQFNGHDEPERGARMSVNSGMGRQVTNARSFPLERDMRSRLRGDRRGPIRPRQKNNMPGNYDTRGAPNTFYIPEIREAADTASAFNIIDRSTANDPSRPIVRSQLFADESDVFTDDQQYLPENEMYDRPSSMTDENIGIPWTNEIPNTQNGPSPRDSSRRQARISNNRPAPRRPGLNRENGRGRRRDQRPSRTRNILSRLLGLGPRVRSIRKRPDNSRRNTRPMRRQPRRRERFNNRNRPNRRPENSNVALGAPDQEHLNESPDRETFNGELQTNHQDSRNEKYESVEQRLQEEDSMVGSQDHENNLLTEPNEDITKMDNENKALWEEGAVPDSNGQDVEETPMTNGRAQHEIDNALSEDMISIDDKPVKIENM